MKTEQELRQLAMDIVDGKVITDRHFNNERDILNSFPLLLFADKSLKEKLADGEGMVYEYLECAEPWAINGFPQFFSVRVLSKEEVQIVLPLYKKFQTLKEELINGKAGTTNPETGGIMGS